MPKSKLTVSHRDETRTLGGIELFRLEAEVFERSLDNLDPARRARGRHHERRPGIIGEPRKPVFECSLDARAHGKRVRKRLCTRKLIGVQDFGELDDREGISAAGDKGGRGNLGIGIGPGYLGE